MMANQEADVHRQHSPLAENCLDESIDQDLQKLKNPSSSDIVASTSNHFERNDTLRCPGELPKPDSISIQQLQPSLEEEDAHGELRNQTWNHIARLLLSNLTINTANGSSDYAYVQVLNPMTSQDTIPIYTYPNNVPSGLVFVDCTGWLPADECVRFLMMGYRVWNEEGRRIHFAGNSIGYDSLKAPIRYDTKMVSLQPADQIPDLHTQIKVGSLYQDPPSKDAVKCGLPWTSRISVGKPADEGLKLIEIARNAWNESRYDQSQTCYSVLQPEEYKSYGGWKLSILPLKDIPPSLTKASVLGQYPKIGVDLDCLNVQWPPFKATVVHENDAHPAEEDALCDICKSLDFKDIFEWGLVDLEIEFGTTDELIARAACPFCRLLAGLCQDGLEFLHRIQSGKVGCPTRVVEPPFKNSKPIKALLVRNPVLCLSTKPHLVLQQSYHREYLGPICSMQTILGDLVGTRTFSPARKVNFSRLRMIINDCESRHGTSCGTHTGSGLKTLPADASRPSSTFLLDVEAMCLRKADIGTVQYAALSYVWGQKAMLRTTRAVVEDFQKPNSLREAGLPPLINDAITVVRHLKVGFLWVDALCIVQDDLEEKQTQIEMMADIYGRAYLTIIALSANSCESLLPGVSQPLPQLIEVVDGMLFTTRLSPLAWNAHNRIYEQRGWTFQERMISRRCLFFTNRQVYFECDNITTSDREQLFPPNDQGRQHHAFNPFQLLPQTLETEGVVIETRAHAYPLHCLRFFCDLISQYTSRHLTYQSDIENAFLGVQSAIRDRLEWNFVGGLAIDVLDWSLLWLPHGQLQRRSWQMEAQMVNREHAPTLQQPPSWSWLGWEGQVSYACYTSHAQLFLQNIRPRIPLFVIKSSSQEFEVHRQPSQIWHPDTQSQIQEEFDAHKETNDMKWNLTGGKATLPWLLDPSCVLEFEADTTPALTKHSETTLSDNGVRSEFAPRSGLGHENIVLWPGRGRSRSRTKRRLLEPSRYVSTTRSLSLLTTSRMSRQYRKGKPNKRSFTTTSSRNRGSSERSLSSSFQSSDMFTSPFRVRSKSQATSRFYSVPSFSKRQLYLEDLKKWRRSLSGERYSSPEWTTRIRWWRRGSCTTDSSRSFGRSQSRRPTSESEERRHSATKENEISREPIPRGDIDSPALGVTNVLNIKHTNSVTTPPSEPALHPHNPLGISFPDQPSSTITNTPASTTSHAQDRTIPTTPPNIPSHSRTSSHSSTSTTTTQPWPSDDQRYFSVPFELLTTGPDYGTLRHGLRHKTYNNNTILHLARSYADANPPRRTELIAMVDADLMMSVRGGQFGEEKSWPLEGRVVCMLVVEVLGDRDGDRDGEGRWERVAVGFCDVQDWDGCAARGEVVRRVVRLV